MKLIKSLPRYRCDFCKHAGTERHMKLHEKICWRNPERQCDACDNSGFTESDEGYGVYKERCYYCGKFDESIATYAERNK